MNSLDGSKLSVAQVGQLWQLILRLLAFFALWALPGCATAPEAAPARPGPLEFLKVERTTSADIQLQLGAPTLLLEELHAAAYSAERLAARGFIDGFELFPVANVNGQLKEHAVLLLSFGHDLWGHRLPAAGSETILRRWSITDRNPRMTLSQQLRLWVTRPDNETVTSHENRGAR